MSATKTLTKPLSIFQKIVLTGGATVLCALNPYRDDMVAVLGEMSCPYTLAKIHKRMTADETGRLILKDKPVINSKTINFDSLSTLPHNTFGKTYYDFMTKS